MNILDMSQQIAALPRKRGAQTLPPRPVSEYVTFHYSAVDYADRSHAAERARVLAEAQYHLNKNWGEVGKPPIYADRYMYDRVVLSDGTVVITGDPRQLWHCGNATGNARSWSVHVMLGGMQDLTIPQHAALLELFDSFNLPRSRYIAHCEWPKGSGSPVVQPVYHQEFRQSSCPGRTLFPYLARYRAQLATEYRTRFTTFVRQLPTTNSAHIATLEANKEVEVLRMVTGQYVTTQLGASDEWAQLEDGGYVLSLQLRRAG